MPKIKAKSIKTIMVYTDGACSNNPGGPGGWAATLNYEERFDIISGHDVSTTNNRMELTAVVEAIKHLIKKGDNLIVINSDSAYVVNAVNKGWIEEWHKKGWKTKQGKELANADLWKTLYKYITSDKIDVVFNKVKGHSGHTFNEIVDEEAKKEVEHAKRILANQLSE